jgi:hypothetical protein
MPSMMTKIVKGIDLDLADGPGYTLEPAETLLREFDGNVEELKASLAAASAPDFGLPWRLLYGGADRHRQQKRRAAKHRQSFRAPPRAADGVFADERGSLASVVRPYR